MVGLNKTVLCVDDDPSVLTFLRTFLELDGYTVITEKDGLAALRTAANSAEIDAFVTDFNMDGLSGEKLCSEVRRVKPEVPILMFTGSPETVPAPVRRLVDVLLSKEQGIREVAAALKRVSA
jgi:DNA-binding response OmpR family regulator